MIVCAYPGTDMAEFDPKDPAFKGVIKEAITEWLDDKFQAFGKWSVGGLAAAGLAGLVYLALVGLGWIKP
jgi:hypothetical protein